MPSRKGRRSIRKRNCNDTTYISENSSRKKRKSSENSDDQNISHQGIIHSESGVSPESLTKRLDRFCSDIINTHKSEFCELADYEFDDGVENIEKLREMREKLRKKLTHFDFEGRTDINLDSAALAGARVMVEERAATRSITKKLTSEVGVDQLSLLYAGLPYEGAETSVAKDIHDERTESIIESFVDFQKQLKFKLNVLGHAIKKIELNEKSKSALPSKVLLRRHVDRKQLTTRTVSKIKNANKTPKKRRKIDPLSFNKIIDSYALEVASELTSKSLNWRRNLAPIPLDLSILDEI